MLPTMRGWLIAAMGLGLGVACSDASFECAGDHQCSLSGTPGVCVDQGQCAYPDPDCASGLSFPLGSPSSQAGECVGGQGSGGLGSSTGSSTTTDSPSTDSSTGDDPDSSGSGSLECDDPYEPNDAVEQGTPILLEGCTADWEAVSAGSLDTDWFLLGNPRGCPLSGPTTVTTSPALTVCILPACPNGLPAVPEDCEGDLVPLLGGIACCATGDVRLAVSCVGEEPLLALRVGGEIDAPQCLPYQASVFL